MTREVSRRTSKPPEQKAKVVRPDIVGKRDLDPRIVEDRVDPVIRGEEMSEYLGSINPTEGPKRRCKHGR